VKTIFVTGAGGYLGRSLIPKLKGLFIIKCLIRKKGNANEIKDCDVVYGDIRDKDLDGALKNIDVVIHLAAITNTLDESIEDVNVNGTKNLIEACKKNKIERFIFISSTAASKANDLYGKTKKHAEGIIIKSKLKYTILRPGIIYSKDSSNLLNIINVNRKIPFFTPIIGDGKYKINPVYINDVIFAIIAVINNKKTINKTYYIVGPRNIEFNEFIDIINKNLHIKRKKIHIPIWLCFLIANLLERLIKKAPVTVSTIKAIKTTSFYSIEEAKEDFNYKPIDFKEGILKIKDGI